MTAGATVGICAFVVVLLWCCCGLMDWIEQKPVRDAWARINKEAKQ